MKPRTVLVALRIGLSALLGALLLWSEAAAGGDAAAGQQKSMFCWACHGLDGNAVHAGTPRLAGQPEGHFVARMKLYKSGKQVFHPVMGLLVNGLSDQDIADLAAFYASQKPSAALKPYGQ